MVNYSTLYLFVETTDLTNEQVDYSSGSYPILPINDIISTMVVSIAVFLLVDEGPSLSN